jgi:hypothetical protein
MQEEIGTAVWPSLFAQKHKEVHAHHQPITHSELCLTIDQKKRTYIPKRGIFLTSFHPSFMVIGPLLHHDPHLLTNLKCSSTKQAQER